MEQKAYYRFLNNDRIEENTLVEEASNRMKGLCKGRALLCSKDTSEINLGNQKGRLKPDSGLGGSDNPQTAHCFKLYPGWYWMPQVYPFWVIPISRFSTDRKKCQKFTGLVPKSGTSIVKEDFILMFRTSRSSKQQTRAT